MPKVHNPNGNPNWRKGMSSPNPKGRPKGAKDKSLAWHEAMKGVITDDDVRAVGKQLVKAARAGETWAVREFFDRHFGKPFQALDVTAEYQHTVVLDALSALAKEGDG